MDKDILMAICNAKKGDEKAYKILFDKYRGYLKSIARSYLSSSFDIDDALQDVWIKIVDNISLLRSNEYFPGWIAKIMRNHCLNLSKANKKYRLVNVSLETNEKLIEASIEDDFQNVLQNEYLKNIFKLVFNEMQEAYVMPMKLFYWENMNIKEISEFLSISESNVKWRLFQGRAILKGKIGKLINKTKRGGYHEKGKN